MCNLRVLHLQFELDQLDERSYRSEWVRQCGLSRLLARGLRACPRLTSVKLVEGACLRWQGIWLPCLQDYAITEFASEFMLCDDACARTIASWKCLRLLDLGTVSFVAEASSLACVLESASVSGQLEVLSVGCLYIEDDPAAWEALVGSLFRCPMLRRVVFREVEKITDRLRSCQLPAWIKEVALLNSDCMCRTPADAAAAARWIGRLISAIADLRLLDISGTLMNEVCFRTVAASIPSGSLRSLLLECCLEDDHIGSLISLLKRSPNIVTLDLKACRLCQPSPEFVMVLSRMQHLRKVEFDHVWHNSYSDMMLEAGFVHARPFSRVLIRPFSGRSDPFNDFNVTGMG